MHVWGKEIKVKFNGSKLVVAIWVEGRQDHFTYLRD